jgi:hypothetical protein
MSNEARCVGSLTLSLSKGEAGPIAPLALVSGGRAAYVCRAVSVVGT